ncbi:MAG TPA: alpha/beta hydrolase-fold protein [Sphingobacteriaceae bacterium]
MKKTLSALILVLLWGATIAQVKFFVRLDSALKGSYTGRLFVETLNDTTKEFGQGGLGPQAGFAIQVNDWSNKTMQVVDSNADYTVRAMKALKPGFYKVAAVLDINTTERSKHATGNLYSRKEALLEVKKGGTGEVTVTINSIFKDRPFRETVNIRELRFQSTLLSKFHKKPVFIKAAVVLPTAYREDSTRVFPVVYIIPGWGGTHYDALGPMPAKRYGFTQGLPKIFVYLNPETQSPFGLHGFVDSRVNGPWGQALVEELVPHVHRHYRASDDPQQTFLMGQSTGGYASAWLMMHYPKAFGGSWGTSPDPVDFTSFIGVNLYQDKNFYVDGKGREREFYKVGGKYLSTIRSFVREELFHGDGGQQQSFEAEFGRFAADGKPRMLFNRTTGAINREVVELWKDYDLGAFLLKNWKRLENDLKGKIHLYAGSEDNFYLNESLLAFRNKVLSLNAELVAEEIPGADHFSLWSPEFINRVHQEMDRKISSSRP